MKIGIDCYTSKETINHLGLTGHRLNVIADQVPVSIGNFKIVPFFVPHNLPNLGFLISHPETGKILFATDCAYIPHKFVGLSSIMLEINYEDSILTSERAVGCHLSLDTALSFLRANDLSRVHSIVLLHLSASNSNEKQFIKAVQAVAPNCKVIAADKGISIELNRNPF